jgi:hypothetical protein
MQTSKSIIQIGLSCGFSSGPHFSSAYRNFFGAAVRRSSCLPFPPSAADLQGLIAGKPAPTVTASATNPVVSTKPCGSWLASDEALKTTEKPSATPPIIEHLEFPAFPASTPLPASPSLRLNCAFATLFVALP